MEVFEPGRSKKGPLGVEESAAALDVLGAVAEIVEEEEREEKEWQAEDAIDAHSKLHEPQGQAIAMTDTEVSRTRDSRAEHDVGEEVWY